MAKHLGVSFTSVNRWENGQTTPSKLAQQQIYKLYQLEKASIKAIEEPLFKELNMITVEVG